MLERFNYDRIKVALQQLSGNGGTNKRHAQTNDDRKSLWDKLQDVYLERHSSADGNKRWKGSRNLLEPLVSSGDFKVSFTVNLLSDAQGYTITPAAKNGSDPESITVPYQDQELLEYLDSQQIPPLLLDILRDCQSCFLYCGCLIAEVRDFRCYHINTSACERHLLLLRPTNQTLAMGVDEMASENNLTEDEKLTLESKLLVATGRPLCLDPSPDVLAITSHIYSERDIYNTNAMRRAIKHQSPVAASRKAVKTLEPTPPEFAFYDFISNSQHQKTTDPAALSLKRKLPADMWRKRPVKLSKPSSIDVSKLVKPVEPDGQEIAFTPELLQHIEIKLDPTGSRGGTDSCKLAIYRRPSDGQYSAVVKFGRDGRYSESQSAQHQLGQKAEAQSYLNHFLDTYVLKAPVKSVTNLVDGQLVGNNPARDLSPFIKSSKLELALNIPKSDNSLELQTEAQLQQASDLAMSSAMATLTATPSIPFIASDSFIPLAQPITTQCQPSPARVTRRHSVPTRRASAQAQSKEVPTSKSPACPTQTAAVQKISAPQTRSGGGRKGNPTSLRSRRSSVPPKSTKVQTSAATGVWPVLPQPGMTIMVSVADVSQNSVFTSSNCSVSTAGGTGYINVQPPIQVTSGQPTSLPSGVSTSSILVNPVGPGSIQTGSHMVMSTMGLQHVSRLVGGQLATVVVPAGSLSAGVSSFTQPLTKQASQQKSSGSDSSKTRGAPSYGTFTAPVSVLTTSPVKGHTKSAASASRLASSKQSIHPATVSVQLQPLSSTAACSAQQMYLNSVAAGTSMAFTQQGTQLQLVQSHQGRPIVLPASAKPVIGQQRSLGQSILVRAPAAHHAQGQLPLQTFQFLSQQLNVPRQKLGSRSSVTSGATSTQKQTPTISHPVHFVLTPGQPVPHMVSGKQVVLQLQPTFGRMAQPSTAPQQQAQHVVPHTMQSVALPAQSLVLPLQITTPSSSTPSVTTSIGKPS